MSELTSRLLLRLMDENEALQDPDRYTLFGLYDHADGDKIFMRLWVGENKIYEEFPISPDDELSAAISDRVTLLLEGKSAHD